MARSQMNSQSDRFFAICMLIVLVASVFMMAGCGSKTPAATAQKPAQSAGLAAPPDMQPMQIQAQESVNTLLLFDSSNSMANSIEGKRKIDLAKSAVTTYIGSLAGKNAALRIYGYQKDSCTASELVIPFGTTDPIRFTDAVNKMEPVGMTPIEYSIRQAAKDFPASGKNIMILVSDGEESCGGDPCAAVKELKAAGATFVVHTVGFDINEAGKAQLQCIAQESGGTYYDAPNADRLNDALYQVKQTYSVGNVLFLDGVEFTIPQISLQNDKDNVESFDMQVRNTKLTPTSFEYKIQASIADQNGKSVEWWTKMLPSKYMNLVDVAKFHVPATMLQSHLPGNYYFRVDFYDTSEKTLLGTMFRTVTLGPQGNIISESPMRMYAPETPKITMDDVDFMVHGIWLNDKKTDPLTFTVEFNNKKQVPTSFEYLLKAYLINEKGDLVDFTNSVFEVTGQNFIGFAQQTYKMGGIWVNNEWVNWHQEQLPGQYTFLLRIYTSGSNVPDKYLSKKITLGLSGNDVSLYEKMTYKKQSTQAFGDVELSMGKVTLTQAKNNIESFNISVKNKKTTSSSLMATAKIYVLNDKGEVLDYTNDFAPLTADELNAATDIQVGLLSKIWTGRSWLKLNHDQFLPGKYTLLVRLYSEGSNIPEGELSKEISFGASASSLQ